MSESSSQIGVTEVRARYGETDQAGVVYHSNYLVYFEIGRTEWLRTLGPDYRSIEEDGVLLTVVEARLRFLRPARYDDLLRIETRLGEVSGARLWFEYEIREASGGELLCTGSTRLAALEARTGRPRRLPDVLRRALASRASK